MPASLWLASTIALVGSHVFDSATSMGRPETNPLLARGPQAQFSLGSVAIKGGIVGGSLLAQRLVLRHHPGSKVTRAATIANFATAGVLSGTGVHNLKLRKGTKQQ